MKYYNEFHHTVDSIQIEELLKNISKAEPQQPTKEIISKIFSLIDLTSLSERDNMENISRMCDQVNHLNESYPDLHSPAAICVYPSMVPVVKAQLSNPLVNIASVAGGFPSSQTFREIKLKEVERAIEAGADEIDIVIPVGMIQLGEIEEVFQEIHEIKELMGNHHLKVILETCSLSDLSEVKKASMLAISADADFIKTSTGKAGKGAEPASFIVMCLAIKEFYDNFGKKVGIKPAGGISDIETAYTFYKIVKEILGDDWLHPDLFRIGASRLANVLIREIYKKDENFSYFN